MAADLPVSRGVGHHVLEVGVEDPRRVEVELGEHLLRVRVRVRMRVRVRGEGEGED